LKKEREEGESEEKKGASITAAIQNTHHFSEKGETDKRERERKRKREDFFLHNNKTLIKRTS
jgi:hypothetical protein